MPETPTFGRYAEIPYDQMTPEQQEGYRSLVETRGRTLQMLVETIVRKLPAPAVDAERGSPS